MKKYLQLIWVCLLVLACIVALSFLPNTVSVVPKIESSQSHSGASFSGIQEKTRSAVDRILSDVEVQKTLERIMKDSPIYNKDGATFVNRERRLPVQKNQNYYSEWTVRTPTESDRGARRIIDGKRGELYFTDDHYTSFTRIR